MVVTSKSDFQSCGIASSGLDRVALETNGKLFSFIAVEYASQVKIDQLMKTTATMMKLVLTWESSVGCKSA